MKKIKSYLFLLFLLFTVISSQGWFSDSEESKWKDKRIPLSSVQVLTLYQDQSAVGKRSTVPQLNCVGGSACRDSENHPRVVQCVNQGKDPKGVVNWKCEADLNNDVTFGRIDVSCEGFSGPGDPFIVEGSCGLEYELHYTKNKDQGYYSNYPEYNYHGGNGSNLGTIIFIALFIYVIWKMIQPQEQYYGGGGGGAGGWGGGGPGGGGPGGPPYGYGNGNGSSSSGGGGFWSGMAAGGLLGYLFGRPRGYGYGGYPGYGYGYGAQPFMGRRYGGGYGGGYGSGYGGGGSFGGGSRSASGFGGTRSR